MTNYSHLIPDFLLSAGGTLILIISAFRDDKAMRDFLRWLALFTVVGAGFALFAIRDSANGPVSADGWLISAPLNIVFGLIFLAIIAWTLLAGNVPEESAGEWYGLLLFAGLGMLTLARSGNFAAIFLGLETLSLALYVLIAFVYGKGASLRAGAMYLILAGFASGFLVFGMALVYAAYGTLDIAELQRASSGPMGYLAITGYSLFLAGVAFKLAVVPFHMWAPDVYEAAPGAISGLIASASKGAMLAALIPFLFLRATHGQIIWMLAVASMIVGNLLGLRETRVKRILAYSSIGHIGYILTGYLAGADIQGVAKGALARMLPFISGVDAIVFYVVAYAIAIMGAFTTLALIDRESDLTLRDLRGVAKRSPTLASCMMIFTISLAGLPPTVGFFGKIYLFSAAVNAGYIWLPILGLIGSGIGIFYYLRILVYLFMMPSDAAELKISHTPIQDAMLVLSAIATIALGIFPDSVFALLHLR